MRRIGSNIRKQNAEARPNRNIRSIIRYSESETFSTFMEFGTNFGLVRNNIGQFLMAILFIVLAQLLVGIAASIALGIGWLVVSVVMAYFTGHVLGQLAGELNMGGEPAMAAA